ncbi:MAG TPA: MlaE family lipid ABC transporter permease subunit [Steroidobacteraceae bacterium]
MFLDSHLHGGVLTLRVSGRWLIENLAAIESELGALEGTPAQSLVVDTTGLEELDLSGAWALFERMRRLEQSGVTVNWRGRTPDQIRFIEHRLTGSEHPAAATAEWLNLVEPVRSLGRWAVTQADSAKTSLAFFGRICAVLGSAFTNPKRLRLPALVRHVIETGLQAVPIVSLIAFLISVIIAYMGATELRRFGAEIFVVDLVTIGVLRELGVLLTAIIVAGRSGSAFAAEIGVMKLNEEVDALNAIGTNPVEVLVMPRVLGLVIALPLLTVIADAVGLTGGGLLCYYLLDIPPAQYLARVQESIAPTTFWVGIIKAPVFAFLIAYIGTLRGMQVRESSRELGRLTTVAVVQSIFLVILADALFAVLFLELDI